jgi:cytidylate kinase
MDSRKNATSNVKFNYRVKLFDEIDRTANEKLMVKGNKVHKMKISKKKGTKFMLKIKRVDSDAPHEAVSNNVSYFGSYEDNGRTLVMALRGMTIDESGVISGEGSDIMGKFTVSGDMNLQTNEVKFFK